MTTVNLAINETVKPIDVMTQVMDAEEFRYNRNENKIIARYPMSGVFSNLSIRFTERSIFFMLSYNVRTPQERRDEMCQFMSKANWKLNLCNLEMDPSDGEVRMRYTYPLDATSLHEKNAGFLLFSVLLEADKYSGEVMAVISGLPPAKEEEATDDEA